MAEQLFDSWPKKYEQWFQTPIGALVQSIELAHIIELLAPERQDRILDVGCGTGIFTENYVRQGAHVTGIDLSLEMLRYGTQKPGIAGMLPAVADMRRLLSGAARPVMILGGSGWTPEARAAITEFATSNRLPVAVSFRRQDLFDNLDDLYIGDLSTSVDPKLVKRVEEADVLLTVGARLGEMTTHGLRHPLGLRLAIAELNGAVAIFLKSSRGCHLAVINP